MKSAANLAADKTPQSPWLFERMIEHPFEPFTDPAHADQGDERPKHVVGAFSDLIDAGVAHHALVRLVAEIGLPAENLDHVVDDDPQRLGGKNLEHGGFEHVILGAAVDEAGALAGGRFHGEGVSSHESDLLLDQLELA